MARLIERLTALCNNMGQPAEMILMILSGKSPSDVEAALKRKAITASWEKVSEASNEGTGDAEACQARREGCAHEAQGAGITRGECAS